MFYLREKWNILQKIEIINIFIKNCYKNCYKKIIIILRGINRFFTDEYIEDYMKIISIYFFIKNFN